MRCRWVVSLSPWPGASVDYGEEALLTGLWIRIYFLLIRNYVAVFRNADPDPGAFLMRIWIQQKNVVQITLLSYS